MKFNIKSRKGFTLIELLVVIGILAVLAAIAIPSVAGLIDRANASADNTNANEYTNAIERFASEYELFCQDISSGMFDKKDMDATQSRVYNILKVEDRKGISLIEIDSDENVADNEIAIYRDTKYPANAYTARLIMQNYTKTSSSTFEPKQSDMHFWYSPDCGLVVVAENNATIVELNDLVISGKDAKGNDLNETTYWIDITNDYENGNIVHNHREIIPSGGTFILSSTGEKLHGGDYFPTKIAYGDIYEYGDYQYYFITSQDGWNVKVNSEKVGLQKTSYGSILEEIANKKVVNMNWCFSNCENLKVAPCIPSTIQSMTHAFYGCKSLINVKNIVIPEGVTSLQSTFYGCTSLRDAGSIVVPSTVQDTIGAFMYAEKLEIAPDFTRATSLTNMYETFLGCYALTTPPKLAPNVTNIHALFMGCTSLNTLPQIPQSVINVEGTFTFCSGLNGQTIVFPCGVDTSNIKWENTTLQYIIEHIDGCSHK